MRRGPSSRAFAVLATWLCLSALSAAGCRSEKGAGRDAPSEAAPVPDASPSAPAAGAPAAGDAPAEPAPPAAPIPRAVVPAPARVDVAAALGLDPAVVLEASADVASPGATIEGAPSVSATPAGLLLSTGGLAGAAGEDLGDDRLPDTTAITLRLAVPPGARALLFTTRFTTPEPGLATPRDDRAVLEGAPGGTVVLDTAASAVAVTGPQRLRAVDLRALPDGASLQLRFSVQDSGDGAGDSTLLLSRFAFSSSAVVTADELARALLVDPDTVATGAALGVRSGAVAVDDVVTAGLGPFAGSIFLSTGLAADGGLGDTDLAGDGAPDCTRFGLTLPVPTRPAGEDPIRSLVFTTRFYTSEHGSAGQDAATATAWVTSAGQTRSVALELGAVRASAGNQSPSVVRAIDVAGAQRAQIVFDVCDGDDGGRLDSGLLLSGMYFSEYEADLLLNPRPGDSRRRTGSYTWSKVLLGSSASVGMAFSLGVTYDSAERRTSGRMGDRWTHTWDWGVTVQGDGQVVVRRGDATTVTFKPDGAGFVPAHDGVLDALAARAGGGHRFTSKDHLTYDFDGDGRLVTVADRNGNAATLTYDGALLVSIVDSRGEPASFAYDGDRRLARVTYAGLAAGFVYRDGNLVTITDPGGGQTRFTYDAARNLLTGTDPAGVVFVRNTYDGEHRVLTQKDGNGAISSNVYAANNRATHTDRDGRTQTTAFDPLDRPMWSEDATGARRVFAYDKNDRRTLERDALGFATRTEYDARGNATRRTGPRGDVSTIRYDGLDQPVAQTDELGATTTIAYDARGNVVSETNPLGAARLTTWDDRGRPLTRTDRRGAVTRYTFTPAGDPEGVVDAEGHRTTYAHDALGRRTAVVDARGSTTLVAYDALAHPVTVTDALGGTMRTRYDGAGRAVAQTDALGRTVTSTYTGTGKLATRADPLGNTTRYAYTGEERVASITDALGHVTAFGYDGAGRTIRVTDAAGGQATSEYDAAGSRVAVTDPLRHRTTFAVDALGRVATETDPLGHTQAARYDARGRVTELTNARGQVLRATHDAAGRLVGLSMTEGDVTFVLDANGDRVKTIEPGGVTTREFDRLHRPVSVTDRFGHTIRYRWDAAGNLKTLTYSDGRQVHYRHDALNRLTAVVDWEGRTTWYAYDAAGQLLHARLPDGSLVAYEHDGAGRLVSVTDTSPRGRITYRSRYTLDAAGRRVKEHVEAPLEPPVTTEGRRFSHDAANQLVADERDAFAYDADGNMVRGTVGRVPIELSYDSAGRLVSAGDARYEYDAEGNRVEAVVDGEARRFVHDTVSGLSRLLEERDAHGTIVARYVYGLGLIAREGLHPGGHRDERRGDGRDHGDHDDRRGCGGELSVYHYDTRGSTVALTDERGAITDRWAYDPYGLVVARDGATPNRFTYDGRDGVQDDGNGLYFMRARYYEPRLMRFVQRDPKVRGSLEDPRTLNRYAYAGGDPIRYVDPTGQYWLIDDLVMMLVGVVVNVIGELVSDLIDWKFDWEDYVGAAVGGIVWGELTLYAGPIVGAMAGAAVQNVVTQVTRLATGKQTGFDFASLGVDVGLGGLFSMFGGSSGWKSLGSIAERSWRKFISQELFEKSLKKMLFEASGHFVKELFGDDIMALIGKGMGSAWDATGKKAIDAAWREAQQVEGVLDFWTAATVYALATAGEDSP